MKTHKSIRRTMFFLWADVNQMASTQARVIQFGAATQDGFPKLAQAANDGRYEEARRTV